MKKTRSILLSLCLILAGVLLTPGTAQAATKKQLTKKIQNKLSSSEFIQDTYYADYDNDGKKELFAISNNDFGDGARVWFASSKQVKCMSEDAGYIWVDGGQGIVTVTKKQKLFLAELSWGGSGSHTIVCYVKEGKAKNGPSGEGICQLSGKQFAAHPSAFDACKEDDFEYKSGHTYKRYYLKWTGSKFKEYVGKKITQKDFKQYKNGSSVLSKIKKAGYKVGTIYKRSNGIININCSKKEGSTTYYENVTVKLKDGKVKVVVCYKNEDNYVKKSSYGGSYKAKGFDV